MIWFFLNTFSLLPITLHSTLLELSVFLIEIDHQGSQLLAWCSVYSNNISIINPETKEDHANFQGVQLKDASNHDLNLILRDLIILQGTYGSWTHLKEISNSTLLVSLHHCRLKSANLEIFDTSQKGKVRKVYSNEETIGGNQRFRRIIHFDDNDIVLMMIIETNFI